MLLLAGCSGGVLDPKGEIAAQESEILLNSVGTMLIIVAPTLLATLAFAWWFRASNRRARYLPDFVYSGRIELIVWGYPLLVILFLGGVIWIGSHRLDPFRPIAAAGKPLEVQVVSLDWKWLFIYPEQSVASVNELVLPVEAPVHFSITSATVMNSFFVPQLGSMIATMHGMVTQLHLKADQMGDLWGQSTQFSGDGFAGMHFVVRVKSNEDFERWVEDARKSACDSITPATPLFFARARMCVLSSIARSFRLCSTKSFQGTSRRPMRRPSSDRPLSLARRRRNEILG